MAIQAADPELVSLLNGTAPAGLRADALSGSLNHTGTTLEQQEEAKQQAQRQEFFERCAGMKRDSDGNVIPPNDTDRLVLMSLDKSLFAKAEATYKSRFGTQPDPLASAQQRRYQNQQDLLRSRNHRY